MQSESKMCPDFTSMEPEMRCTTKKFLISNYTRVEIRRPRMYTIYYGISLQASARPNVVNMEILPQGIRRMITNVDDDTGLQ